MNNAGYIKDITIKETDDIMQKIQETFPVLLGKDWTLRNSSQKGWTTEYKLAPGLSVTYALIRR